MRLAIVALLLSCAAGAAQAIPTTYLFYGETKLINVVGQVESYKGWDPNERLVVDGQEIYNGQAAVTGSITIDWTEMDYTREVNAERNFFYGQVLNWQLTTEGRAYYPFTYQPSIGQYVQYFDDHVYAFDEIPATIGPLGFDVAWLTFNFNPGYLAQGIPNELPVEAFTGGEFYLGGPGGGAFHGAMRGEITSLVRASPVPEPATVALLLAGLAGVVSARIGRRQPQNA